VRIGQEAWNVDTLLEISQHTPRDRVLSLEDLTNHNVYLSTGKQTEFVKKTMEYLGLNTYTIVSRECDEELDRIKLLTVLYSELVHCEREQGQLAAANVLTVIQKISSKTMKNSVFY